MSTSPATPKQHKTSDAKRAWMAKQRAERNADPEKLAAHRAYMKEYAKKNREKLNAASSERYHNNHDARFKYLLRRLGVPITDELLETLRNHKGTCDICGSGPDDRWSKLAIDHCHTTNTYRGMLCGRCNKGIGQFEDSPDRLRRAAAYLEP